MKQTWQAVQYASLRLLGDKEFMIQCCREDQRVLQFAGVGLKESRNFIQEALLTEEEWEAILEERRVERSARAGRVRTQTRAVGGSAFSGGSGRK